MTIGIDASRALRKIKTGTEWYSVEIILNLAAIDKKNDYILYSHEAPSSPLDNLPPNFKWRIMPFTRGWTLFRLSWEIKKNAPDVLFIPAHTLPLITGKKSVVMIHDLGFMHNPELYPLRQKIYHNFVINYVKKHATHILAPSQYSKKDIITNLGIPKENITVIHHGYDHNLYQARPDLSHPSADYLSYIFFIGRLETKKNVINLIEAFRILRTELLASGQTLNLVLAGQPSHGYDQIKAKIISLGNLSSSVIELGYVAEEDLPIYFSNAACFAFPTLFEGFGIPVIQAQACGTPVICSKTTSLPEIAGDAALLINPRDPRDIAQALRKVLTDQKVHKDLVQKGYKNVERFSWHTAAQKTLTVLEDIASSKK